MPSPSILVPLRCAALAAAAALLVSCGENSVGGMTSRELSVHERSFQIPESDMERFRYRTVPTGDATAAEAGSGPRLVYTTPEGWKAEPSSMMRDINFSFGEDGEGECYVARLPGAGGGLEANVNRWRGQMGADPLSEEEIEGLPRKPLFGQPATFVDIEGDYTPGMGTDKTFEDYRLLGLILTSDAGAVFVKLTGPRELVDENEEAFDEFVGSIDVSMN